MAQTTLDFSTYIAERTRDFTSRVWVFAEIERWLADADTVRSSRLAALDWRKYYGGTYGQQSNISATRHRRGGRRRQSHRR